MREKYHLGTWPVNSVLDWESGLPTSSWAPVQSLDSEPHWGLPETATKGSAPEGLWELLGRENTMQSRATPGPAPGWRPPTLPKPLPLLHSLPESSLPSQVSSHKKAAWDVAALIDRKRKEKRIQQEGPSLPETSLCASWPLSHLSLFFLEQP